MDREQVGFFPRSLHRASTKASFQHREVLLPSASFYLPNNTTVCTSTSTQLRRAGQQGLTRTLTAALERVIKQLPSKSITQVKYYNTNEKTRKINLFNAIPKTVKDVKFTVDGTAFQTFITLSTKNFCSMLLLAVHLGLNSLYGP